MNHENPSALASSTNVCYETSVQIAALAVHADDEHHYLLPYAQFLYAERTANPDVEKDADAPPEKILIRFAMAEVLVLGTGLAWIETRLQKYELKWMQAADRRLAAEFRTHLAVISVNFTKENI
jgi:hypothetical protein